MRVNAVFPFPPAFVCRLLNPPGSSERDAWDRPTAVSPPPRARRHTSPRSAIAARLAAVGQRRRARILRRIRRVCRHRRRQLAARRLERRAAGCLGALGRGRRCGGGGVGVEGVLVDRHGLRHHRADVRCVGGHHDRAPRLSDALEGVHVLLREPQRGGRVPVARAQGASHQPRRLGSRLRVRLHRRRVALAEVDSLLHRGLRGEDARHLLTGGDVDLGVLLALRVEDERALAPLRLRLHLHRRADRARRSDVPDLVP
mmetsp:Transcript_32599/g.97305  ORF Transcript_32599/g.97305 Transcript_32599/m.97305 type:complete len:258 (-) Transcript_32599:540-1313(-)